MEARSDRVVLFCGLLLLPLLLHPTYGAKGRSLNMVFYMHDVVSGPNSTVTRVTAPMGNFSQPFGFGTTMVIDDKLTSGPTPETAMVGRAQGFYINSAIKVGLPDLFLVFTAVMHSPPRYNGSTLCFMGSDRISLPQREIAVVGGTGAFRFARGFAIMETIELSVPDAILKFNVTLRL